MDIKIKDFVGILSNFDPNDTICIDGSANANIHVINVKNGFTQIQFKREKNQIKYRLISSDVEYNPSDYIAL